VIVSLTLDNVLAIRQKVLWPNLSMNCCIVDGDKDAMHYGAMVDNNLVSVASVFIDNDAACLRKFATLPSFQGRGIGSFLVKSILTDLTMKKVHLFWCDARETAVSFYERLGMTVSSERYYKQDIPCIKMTMTINNP